MEGGRPTRPRRRGPAPTSGRGSSGTPVVVEPYLSLVSMSGSAPKEPNETKRTHDSVGPGWVGETSTGGVEGSPHCRRLGGPCEGRSLSDSQCPSSCLLSPKTFPETQWRPYVPKLPLHLPIRALRLPLRVGQVLRLD